MDNKIKDVMYRRNSIYIYPAMFLLSMSLFIYEVLLTRLFSAILNSTMVFLVVSLAILGSGLGGIYSYRRLNKNKNLTGQDLMIRFSIWLPVSIGVAVGAIYYIPYVPVFIFYTLAGAVPFLIGGIVISVIFKDNAGNSNKLYFMDLIGSALGSLGVIQLMNRLGFLPSVIVVCILSLAAAALISINFKNNKSILGLAIAILLFSGLLIQGEWVRDAGKYFNAFYTNPDKIMSFLNGAVKPSQAVSYTEWDAISRTDVVLDPTNVNEKIISQDGGSAAPIIKFDGNLNSVEYLKKDIRYIPFNFGKKENTLVIGSGGGIDVLVALLAESKNIDAVEINPSTIAAVNNFKDYSGDIYNRPGVKLYVEDGRNFINNSNKKYDNIYLSMVMTNAIQNNMYATSENYIFTYEAFGKYLDHLSQDGKLNFMSHEADDTLRIVNTGIKVLMDRGVKQEDVAKYFVIVNGMDDSHMQGDGVSIHMPLIMFKNAPFTNEELNSIKAAVSSQKKTVIQSPEQQINFYRAFTNKQINYKDVLDLIPFNSAPIKDSSPFFFNFSKFVPLQLLLLILGIILIIIPLWIFIQKSVGKVGVSRISIYFAGLGMAYMLVEIPVIQKITLYFGSPSLAFSFILFSLLLSSGIGSMISGLKPVRKITDSSPAYLLAAAVGVAAIPFMISGIMGKTGDMQIYFKFIIGFMTILPMGLLMGVPFPTGISRLKGEWEEVVPLMWGVNGIFSVAGSVLAVIVSMLFSFNIALYIGALIYITLFVINPLKLKSSS